MNEDEIKTSYAEKLFEQIFDRKHQKDYNDLNMLAILTKSLYIITKDLKQGDNDAVKALQMLEPQEYEDRFTL